MVIDTCIFIEYLRAKDKTATKLYNLPDDEDVFISAVTLYELYAGARTKDKRQNIVDITKDLNVLPFTAEVADKAAQLQLSLVRSNQVIGLPDTFIAATCLVFDQAILTLNKKHFQRIDKLKVLR